ncbi:patatin-like phospholipase family protein [Sandarakinorhabdus limnophila]|uniref:patatin-like phospholipase family protein n=1 Tax=Sandarakinorhabdus limnophila TaxID=210512 RepID=UPI0026F16696|nr:patatin-like phospholipase family protein [Sandarakinorhabdus limnophila]
MTDPHTLQSIDAAGRHQECDLIMKGGVTSGLVYPGAIATLSETFRLRNIGGTSADAIGAVAAAAMEYGLQTGRNPKARERMAWLHEELAQRTDQGASRLDAMFCGDPGTAPLLDALKGALNSQPAAILGLIKAALPTLPGNGRRALWLAAGATALEMLAGAGLGWLLTAGCSPGVQGFATALAAVASLAFAGWWNLKASLVQAVPLSLDSLNRLLQPIVANGLGLATGFALPAHTFNQRQLPSLTQWLHQTIQQLAGLDEDSANAVLTFGKLWSLGLLPEPSALEPRAIDLVLVCSDLNRVQSTSFPFLFDNQRFFYDPAEWARRFPNRCCRRWTPTPGLSPAAPPSPMIWARTVSDQSESTSSPSATPSGRAEFGSWPRRLSVAMHKASRPPRSLPRAKFSTVPLIQVGRKPLYGRDEVETAVARLGDLGQRLRRLPKGRHIPILVGARAAMAFPGLFTPLPLWVLRWVGQPEVPEERTPFLSRLYLSDGGITSNFPIHLFDAVVPSRPTFAINLLYPDDDLSIEEYGVLDSAAVRGKAVPGNVRTLGGTRADTGSLELSDLIMPFADGDRVAFYKEPAAGSPLAQLAGLGLRVVETARTWGDVSLYNQVGMRDRIIHVRLAGNEGGFNLSMPAQTITALSNKGTFAGSVLACRFRHDKPVDPLDDPADPRFTLTWDNHRRIRVEGLLAAQDLLAGRFNALWPDNSGLVGDAHYRAVAHGLAGIGALAVPVPDPLAGALRPLNVLRMRPSGSDPRASRRA